MRLRGRSVWLGSTVRGRLRLGRMAGRGDVRRGGRCRRLHDRLYVRDRRAARAAIEYECCGDHG
jgi:hypothetical protein